jgi:hypothetical protein
MPIRVLFADDQLPFNDPVQDAAVREEICKEFEIHRGRKPSATAEGFEDDYSFFSNLLKFLVSGRGVKVTKVRSFDEAKSLIESYDPKKIGADETIDAAIIDLSWWGDKTLNSGYEGRHNKGFELLDCAQAKFERQGIFIPCIAYSQNFYEDPAIMGEVLKRGAMPIPKVNRKEDKQEKREMGYQALFSAIEHLKRFQPINDTRRQRMERFEKDLRRKRRNFEYILFGALGIFVLALLIPIFAPGSDSTTTLVVQALIGTGGASLLRWAWKDQRASGEEFSNITKDFGIPRK